MTVHYKKRARELDVLLDITLKRELDITLKDLEIIPEIVFHAKEGTITIFVPIQGA